MVFEGFHEKLSRKSLHTINYKENKLKNYLHTQQKLRIYEQHAQIKLGKKSEKHGATHASWTRRKPYKTRVKVYLGGLA